MVAGAGCFIEGTGSNPVFTNCTISDNAAAFGGALYIMNQARPTFNDTIFNNNTAQTEGGALNIATGAAPSFTNCTVAHNRVTDPTSGSGGGGAAISGRLDGPLTDPVFVNTHFSNNSTPASGGGLYILKHSKPKFVGCTISSNTAHDGGGVNVAQTTAPEFFTTHISPNRAGIASVHDLANQPLAVCS